MGNKVIAGKLGINGPWGKNIPGQRGWFARVLIEGDVRVNDEVAVISDEEYRSALEAQPPGRFADYEHRESKV